MRTTVRLDDQLLDKARRYGLDRGKTLTAVIREALVAYLAREEEPAPPASVTLPASGSGGLAPGVDLDDSAALLDLMESS